MTRIDNSHGTDLTLIGLGQTEIGALDDDSWWDYEDQLQHHCIRLAWKKAFHQKLPVRACLNIIYAKPFMASERARGNAIDRVALSERLEELRQYHELSLCLGFFVDSEADRIMHGAEKPSYPNNLSILTPKDLGLKNGEHSPAFFPHGFCSSFGELSPISCANVKANTLMKPSASSATMPGARTTNSALLALNS
jgi:hypothetical protein